MTLKEFKAWFDGFSEGIDKMPTEKQWAKIKSKMKEIDDTPISYPIFIDRYVQPHRPWFEVFGPVWANPNTAIGAGVAHVVEQDSLVTFNSQEAMHAAGRAEFQAMAA